MRRFIFAVATLAMVITGCEQKTVEKTSAPVARQSSPPAIPSRAQGHLQTAKLWLGSQELVAELALTPDQEQTGLMFRTNMEDNAGMLFVFGGPTQASFWMKNCSLPLSAAYINPSGNIVELHELMPENTNSVVAASDDVQYVLEVNQGWFLRHHVPIGTLVRTENGSLAQSFIRRAR